MSRASWTPQPPVPRQVQSMHESRPWGNLNGKTDLEVRPWSVNIGGATSVYVQHSGGRRNLRHTRLPSEQVTVGDVC